ncbi:DUF4202 domain-containing protein [Segetibacter sp. 3557_3]|uniref:DUF4202 domain-containing protein n=1 Tax=Segetibacter sp. 3557_3 TaxID=2547429 RepID=UPI0010591B97|nr:DUF4202 domain-containing protein [Segetibacter sp. 3557_3]TDH27357.1 DUF4202 domain-containing protein [Segetibacter sp. 3557_3]
MTRFETAINLFDTYNRQDPHQLSWEGNTYPAEYFYALKLYEWVTSLEPSAGESLLLASRSQHIGRWKTPRSVYPDGKAGYLNWRKDLARFHASTAGELMQQAGYQKPEIEPVKHIILKEDLRYDREVQVMENALCLVFLQYQFADFLQKHEDDKIVHILKRTWKKMTTPGHEAAALLQFDERGQRLLHMALG